MESVVIYTILKPEFAFDSILLNFADRIGISRNKRKRDTESFQTEITIYQSMATQ